MNADIKTALLLGGFIIGKYSKGTNTIVDADHAAQVLKDEFGIDVLGESTKKVKVKLRNFISDQQYQSSIGNDFQLVDDSDNAYDRAMKGM